VVLLITQETINQKMCPLLRVSQKTPMTTIYNEDFVSFP
jgi:hypothetical protein